MGSDDLFKKRRKGRKREDTNLRFQIQTLF